MEFGLIYLLQRFTIILVNTRYIDFQFEMSCFLRFSNYFIPMNVCSRDANHFICRINDKSRLLHIFSQNKEIIIQCFFFIEFVIHFRYQKKRSPLSSTQSVPLKSKKIPTTVLNCYSIDHKYYPRFNTLFTAEF